MAKKPISRVRRKKGAVLFAVIAIMALLIAMASTAYFTARSSYNSVISNYSYSQLYLSAISVSDMVVEAVINDSTAAATDTTGSDPSKNYYDSLRDSVLAMNTVGETMSAYTGNIANPAASQEDIIEELRNGNNPSVPGVVDGVVVNIELTSDGAGSPTRGPIEANDGLNSKWYWFEYAYKFTTTAYYRDNTITVEDIIVTEKARLYTPSNSNPGPGGPGIPGFTDTITTPGGGNGSFSTFFTATGQKLEGGTITRSPRTVLLRTHEISDDAFFQNENTFFLSENNNVFKGGITSTGSIFLQKMTTQISGPNNDWWIGKDLVITDAMGANLNLTKENNLYVGRDLVLGSNSQARLTAKDIYIEGDLYIMGDAPYIDANLHVNGNIYYEMPKTTTDANNNVITTARGTADANGVNFGGSDWQNYQNGWKVESGNTLSINGEVYLPSGKTNDAKINGLNFKNGEEVTGSGISKWDPEAVKVTYSNRIPNYESDEFEDVESDPTDVSTAIQSQVGTNTKYYNYTSSSETYKNEVVVDFDVLAAYPIKVKDAQGKETVTHYEYTDPDTGLHVISSGTDLKTSTITVDLPSYDKYKQGYVLDIKQEGILNQLGGNTNLVYNIQTSNDPTAEAMPMVLKDNMKVDADGDGVKNDPGFSWGDGVLIDGGKAANGEGAVTKVQTIGDGNVVFEMANINDKGEYTKYDPNNHDKFTTVTYVTGEKEIVGTQEQVEYIESTNPSFDSNNMYNDLKGMLQTGTSIPKDEYQNRIMLVSNANDKVAYDAVRKANLFCGYIYAPNAQLKAYQPKTDKVDEINPGKITPVFGGMIVSTYTSRLSDMVYAEPKPSIISSMLGSLDLWAPGGNSGGTTTTITVPDIPGTPPTPPPPPGPGNWGDPENTDIWNYKGSNFVG